MEKQHILDVVNECWRQLFWSAGDPNVFFSWGISQREATIFEGMPTLALKVSGLLHKGLVYISLNEGHDLYEIRLIRRNKVVKVVTDVYADSLGTIIDSLIEKPLTMSEEEYHEKALADSASKMAED